MSILHLFQCARCKSLYNNREDATRCGAEAVVPAGEAVAVHRWGVVYTATKTYDIGCGTTAEVRAPRQFYSKLRGRAKETHWSPRSTELTRLTVKDAQRYIREADQDIKGYERSIKDAEARKRWFEKFIKEEEKKNNA